MYNFCFFFVADIKNSAIALNSAHNRQLRLAFEEEM
jgi:hypothetical protein